MKDSERWDNRAKAHYHQWKCYEFEARANETDVVNDKHYKDLIRSYQQLEQEAKKQAARCRDWERDDG